MRGRHTAETRAKLSESVRRAFASEEKRKALGESIREGIARKKAQEATEKQLQELAQSRGMGTERVDRRLYEQPPELTEADEEILDKIWRETRDDKAGDRSPAPVCHAHNREDSCKAYVDHILNQYLYSIVFNDGVAVPDDEEEMNWRLFFAHSQDMQGFAADVFTGGPNEGKNRYDASFVGLRDRWGDSRSMIAGLGSLWEKPDTRSELERLTRRGAPGAEQGQGVKLGLQVLRGSCVAAARDFADTLDDLRGHKIAFKTNRMIRAYVQNSCLLKKHNCSFRAYLQSVVPSAPFPPRDTAEAERRWITALDRDLYNVGAALANYLIGDWLLWLWREGRVDWFESYKRDFWHESAITQGLLPEAACHDFVAYCRGLRLPGGFGALSSKPLPPRILNECIYIDKGKSWTAVAHPG